MEFVFIILSWMILLVPGFDNSVPPTDDKVFKIEANPDIVQSIKITSDKRLDFWGFDIELKKNSTNVLEVMIPKNLPTPASYINSWSHEKRPVVFADKKEVIYDTVEDPCYFRYSIPIKGQTNVEIVYTVILAGTWQLYSPVQFDENNPCYQKVFYEKPIDSPLKQFRSGIMPKDIVCKEGFELVIKSTNGHPACVKPQSAEKLIQRMWAAINKVSELSSPQIYLLTEGEKTFQIPYSLKGAKLAEIIKDDRDESIHVILENAKRGELTISIPRDLIDAKLGQTEYDDVFFVLIDGKEHFFAEKAGKLERTLTIPFPDGAQNIEIIGTNWL